MEISKKCKGEMRGDWKKCLSELIDLGAMSALFRGELTKSLSLAPAHTICWENGCQFIDLGAIGATFSKTQYFRVRCS